MHLYLNGQIIATNDAGSHFNSSRTLLCGLSLEMGSGFSYYGEMNELRLWSVVRTENQIQKNMYKKLNSGDGVYAAYHMAGGGGEYILYDSINRGMH